VLIGGRVDRPSYSVAVKLKADITYQEATMRKKTSNTSNLRQNVRTAKISYSILSM
jgi:hypothetical protein